MIAFWPLTKASQGANLVPAGTAVQLTGVVFSGDPAPWKSIPAGFQGSASSYATGKSTVDFFGVVSNVHSNV